MNNSKTMDTQNLIAFQTVAELGSFSSAAELLRLTQPAVSKRIASLEQQLDCRLFDRIGRTVTLTESGRALLPRARLILKEVAETRRLITDLSGDISGPLRLATSHHIGLHRLPPFLRHFSKNHPRVDLDIKFLDSEKAYEGILHGQFELAIITLAPLNEPRICTHELWTDPLKFVVSPEHGLSSTAGITLKKLSQFPAILPKIETFTTRLVKHLFDRQNLNLNIVMETNYLETLKMMTSIGLGWSVLPVTMIDDQVTEIQVRQTDITRTLGCIYHRDHTLSNAANAFVKMLIQKNKI